MFPTIIVDSAYGEAVEPLGAKAKFWYRDPQNRDRRMLFKEETRGTGEDWAEVVACELCALLNLPHAKYQLAVDRQSDKPGVVCESIVPINGMLIHGNQLLLERDPDYPTADDRKYKVSQHTVIAVSKVLSDLLPPQIDDTDKLSCSLNTALDIYIGYVLLDTWLANQDRHHQNWGAIRVGQEIRLAPSFDHGASMARNLTDEERLKRLETTDAGYRVEAFAAKARSAFFETNADSRPLTTLDAWQRFSSQSPMARSIWLEKLNAIKHNAVGEILAQVPPHRMTPICRDFTLRLLNENRRRLLETSL